MKYMTVPLHHHQQGAALAVALMVLLVLTLVAVSAMDGSTLGFKMGANAIYHEEAFNNSESGRDPIGQALVDFAEYGEWDGVVDNVNGDLQTVSNDLDLLDDNVNTEDLQVRNGLTTDLVYSQTLANGAKIEANVAVFKGKTVANSSGSGAAQYKGYHGAGVGIGGEGGMHKYFEFRSEGNGPSNAEAWTATDFRYVP